MAKIDLEFFEKVIIQQCLKKDSAYIASCVEYLDKNLFRNKDIGAIINIIKEFYIEHDMIPTLTELKTRITTAQLKGNLKNVVDSIRQLDSDFNEDELIQNTEYFIKQRKLDLLVEDVIDQKTSNKEVDMDKYQKDSDAISCISLVDNLGLDYFGDNDKVVEYILEKDTFISTGYKGVDDAMGGGMYKEGRAIYAIGGETNVGKSIMVGNIATNVLLQNYNVVLITLEMSEKRYAKRISSMLTKIALNQLSDKIEDYKQKVKEFVESKKSRLVIKEFSAKSVSAKHIHAFFEKLYRKKKFRPDLIVIDYCSLLKPSVTQSAKHAEMQFIIQETRGLSYLHTCPILTPFQLNRGSHKSAAPGLDSTAGSWDMLSDLDNVINLAQTDEDREANIIRYCNGKARDGAKGIGGVLQIDYETLRFYEELEDTMSHNVIDAEIENMKDLDLEDLYS